MFHSIPSDSPKFWLKSHLISGLDVRAGGVGVVQVIPLRVAGVGVMALAPHVKPATMGHVQSSPAAELDLSVQGKFSMSVIVVGA